MAHDAQSIDKHVRLYIIVFVALLVLTGVTVGVSYIDMSRNMAIAVAILVACLKGSLVIAFFMHVFDEFRESKPVLFWSLLSAVAGFLMVLLIPLITHLERLGH